MTSGQSFLRWAFPIVLVLAGCLHLGGALYGNPQSWVQLTLAAIVVVVGAAMIWRNVAF